MALFWSYACVCFATLCYVDMCLKLLRVCVHVRVNIGLLVMYVYVCVRVYVRAWMYTCVPVYDVFVCARASVCAYMCTLACMYVS